MGCHAGTRVKNATHLRQVDQAGGNRAVMIHPDGINTRTNRLRVFCDVTSGDENLGWHLTMTVFPRIRTPYTTASYDCDPKTKTGRVPLTTDTDMVKFADADLKIILNTGNKMTKTQWWHTSVEYPGTVWANGSDGRGIQYNEFETPDNWASSTRSGGQRYKRRWQNSSWTGWITSQGGTCSSAVGGWSNYYEQSCVQSWWAGCEGGPAINHKCAGDVQDRAEKLFVWAA
jgi:hypothetical protein